VGVNPPPYYKQEVIMKLTNGNRIIERSKVDYEANLKTWTLRGWKPVEDKPKVNKVEIPKKGR
tara:strand:+ start:270 stop:458 length:189 start_codon:yes stop_codon:yes gene_type:complete